MLDVGCGAGDMLLAIHWKNRNIKLYGLEPIEEFVEIAKNKLPNAQILQGLAENLPYKDSTFDCVISHFVYQHVDREVAVKEAKRVLTESGTLVIAEVLSQELSLSLKEKVLMYYSEALSNLHLIFTYGLKTFTKAQNYANSTEWAELTAIHRHRRFTYQELYGYYQNALPSCQIKLLSSNIVAVVWTKPSEAV